MMAIARIGTYRLPNRLLSSAKIVKAERKRELVPSFPRRFPSSGKMAQAEGKDKFIRLCLGEACLNESIRFRKGMKNLGLYVPVFCGSLADFIGSAARTDQNGSSRPKPNQQLPSLGL